MDMYGPYTVGLAGPDPVKYLGDKLWPGQMLRLKEGIRSKNDRVRVVLQTDGNCVLYGDGNPLWWTGVRPGVNQAVMQNDGNFVLYKPGEGAVWASDTAGHPGAYLVAQDDGNLVMYWRVGGSALWSSQTNGFRYYGGPGKGISFEDVLDVAGDVLTAAQVVISFVPGIGQGVNAAIAAGAALARGENITDAVAAAAKNALPGGPVAAAAFDAAVATGKAIARGESISDVALAATRAALPSEEAKRAFDVGMAVAHGQSAQQALVSVVASLAPETGRVAQELFKRPELLNITVSEAAKALKSDPATVQQATMALNSNKALRPPPPTVRRPPPALKPRPTPEDADKKMLAALMILGANPADKAARQQLVGASWEWAAAWKDRMRPADLALTKALDAWAKKPDDKPTYDALVIAGQDWSVSKGIPVPKKPLVALKPPTPPAKKPLVALKPTAAARSVYGPYPSSVKA